MTTPPGLLRNPYEEWLDSEGLPVTEGFSADLLDIDLRPWSRFGGLAGFVHLGASDFASVCVLELAAAAASEPQRHMFEEIVYVLEGRGTTSITGPDGRNHSFEWGPRSLFAIPLNAPYRHHNLTSRRARLACTVSLPLVMNAFREPAFVFENDWTFPARFGDPRRFAEPGHTAPGLHARPMWETNFVPDLGAFGELREWGARGGSNIALAMADGTMHAHVSEMPVGTYKKGHRHGPDFHIFCVAGSGYSLFWFEGDAEFRRVDWRHGVVLAPQNQQFHQHFNTGAAPARYLATAYGSYRFPFTSVQRFSIANAEKSASRGGIQIEFEEQDPRIQLLYEAETARNGVTHAMVPFAPRRA